MVFLFSREPLTPARGASFVIVLRHLEVEGVAPLAETGEQDPVAGLGLFEGGDEHEQRMGRPGLAADLVHRVDHLLRGGAQLLGDRPVLRLEEAGEDDLLHVVHRDAELLEEAAHRLGDELRVALLAEPALLPHVVVAAFPAPR